MKCQVCDFDNPEDSNFCSGCGENLNIQVAQETLLIEQGLDTVPHSIQKDRFVIHELLGEGKISRVYLAEDTKENRAVAVKEIFIPPKLFQENINQEIERLISLKFTGIPRIFEFFAEHECYYVIMEYVVGENLDEILQDCPGRQMDKNDFFQLMSQAIDLLDYYHSQGMIHRDIKPENFILDEKDNLHLVDFSTEKTLLSRDKELALNNVNYFSAPETVEGENDFSLDIFSLGAVFHYMLSGEHPSQREPFTFPPLSNYRKDIPRGILKIFQKMLAKHKNERYLRVKDIKFDLEFFKTALLEDEEKSDNPEKDDEDHREENLRIARETHEEIKRINKIRFRNKILVVLVLLLLIIILSLLFVFNVLPGFNKTPVPVETTISPIRNILYAFVF